MNTNIKTLAILTSLSLAPLAPAAPSDTQSKTKVVDREVSDALAAVSVKTRLIQKLGVDALGITVSVSGEKATLEGHVSKSASQGLAEQVALSVDGIKKVDNKVTESNPAGPTAATEASVKNVSLEMKVKSILLGEVGTNALKIEVEAVDGVVSLRGKLDDPETSKVALRKVKAIKGVKKVVNLLG